MSILSIGFAPSSHPNPRILQLEHTFWVIHVLFIAESCFPVMDQVCVEIFDWLYNGQLVSPGDGLDSSWFRRLAELAYNLFLAILHVGKDIEPDLLSSRQRFQQTIIPLVIAPTFGESRQWLQGLAMSASLYIVKVVYELPQEVILLILWYRLIFYFYS